MLKPLARLVAACATVAALPVDAQPVPPAAPPPAATVAGPAEGLAWRGFQACLAVQRGILLDKAAAEAGFLKDDKGWAAEIGERTLTIELATPPSPPGAKGCVVVSRGPLADHAGFNKRIAAWAAREGFAAPQSGVTSGGGQTDQYAVPDGSRVVVLALYAETGNPAQPPRTLLFYGWTAP